MACEHDRARLFRTGQGLTKSATAKFTVFIPVF